MLAFLTHRPAREMLSGLLKKEPSYAALAFSDGCHGAASVWRSDSTQVETL